MWNEIYCDSDVAEFMDTVADFHDSCIKEMRYLSGAYVNERLAMSPINDKRTLRVVFQRQFESNSMIELEFDGLRYLKLYPLDERYTCEILDATIILKNDCVCWCDCGGLKEKDLESYRGTIICASKLRWRSVDNCMGNRDFYIISAE